MHIRLMSIIALVTTSALSAAATPTAAPSTQTPLITVPKDLSSYYRSAYIKWPKGARVTLDAGECGILIQSNKEFGSAGTQEVINSPARIVNNLCKSLAGYVALHHGALYQTEIEEERRHRETFCKENIVQVLTEEHDGLLAAYLGAMPLEESPKITAFAIALAYRGTVYHAQTRWDGISDVLMPFVSVDDITLSTKPVDIMMNGYGQPIALPKRQY